MDSEEDIQKRAKEGIRRIESECCMLYSVQIKERGLVKFRNVSTFPAFQKKTGGHQGLRVGQASRVQCLTEMGLKIRHYAALAT